MEKQKIARINALARKSRTEGLTEAEKAEQAALRQEYLAAIRQTVNTQLETAVVEEPDGSRHPLRRKGDFLPRS
jgi:uncharacterized protein YnzC (UPF0291/DUF896 family)